MKKQKNKKPKTKTKQNKKIRTRKEKRRVNEKCTLCVYMYTFTPIIPVNYEQVKNSKSSMYSNIVT